MLQILLILCIGTIVAHDALPITSRPAPEVWNWFIAANVLGSMAAVAATTHALIWWCARRLDDTGSARFVFKAERVVNLSRLAYAALLAWGVLGLGWADCVRAVTGDLPAIDELLILSPFILGLCAGWASFHAIDRRLREASLMGVLDSPQPVMTLPTTWQYVLDQLRHQVLILLAPMIGITAWSEGTVLAADALLKAHPHLFDTDAAQWAFTIVQFAGVLVVLMLMPLGLRFIWSTSRLGNGPLRQCLQNLCERQRVRCREFLVWHTHTGMVNGALVGFLPRARYILLTDALLERMTEREVEAVMAHEVGHAARRHIPWMAASVIVTTTLSHTALSWLGPKALPHWLYVAVDGGGRVGPEFALSMLLGLFVFGVVSRRFERQADAFAAQHLSGWSVRRREPTPAPIIDAAACQAMADALTRVARLAHLEESRFTFRHGSIAQRKRNVMALAGESADKLIADRAPRVIKCLATIGILMVLILAVLDWWANRDAASRGFVTVVHSHTQPTSPPTARTLAPAAAAPDLHPPATRAAQNHW